MPAPGLGVLWEGSNPLPFRHSRLSLFYQKRGLLVKPIWLECCTKILFCCVHFDYFQTKRAGLLRYKGVNWDFLCRTLPRAAAVQKQHLSRQDPDTPARTAPMGNAVFCRFCLLFSFIPPVGRGGRVQSDLSISWRFFGPGTSGVFCPPRLPRHGLCGLTERIS